MRFAFGVLRMTPDQFWSMTLYEFFATVDGWREAHEPPKPSEASKAQKQQDLLAYFRKKQTTFNP